MSTNNYISNLLNLKDPNLIFDDVVKENINDNVVTVIYGKLVNKPKVCPHCGGTSINIHGYKQCTIKIIGKLYLRYSLYHCTKVRINPNLRDLRECP